MTQEFDVGKMRNLGYLMDNLDKLYEFDDEVRDFLLSWSELYPFLYKLYFNIREFFPDSRLGLQLDPDPEIDNYTFFIINIEYDGEADECIELLDAFDDKYWLDAIDEFDKMVGSNLSIVTDITFIGEETRRRDAEMKRKDAEIKKTIDFSWIYDKGGDPEK